MPAKDGIKPKTKTQTATTSTSTVISADASSEFSSLDVSNVSFTPRLSAPSTTDKWWLRPEGGGVNHCIPINGGPSVLPNCTGYAWGRFSEILGQAMEGSSGLCRHNAGEWFGFTSDGYARGQQPYLGAVICFSREGKNPSTGTSWAGHVAIVEEIPSSDSGSDPILDLKMSESGYGGNYRFGVSSPRYYINKGYFLQGFIYNPAVQGQAGLGLNVKTRLDIFIESAQNHLNEDNSWVCEVTGITSNQAWSAAFVVACAKQASSLLNVIIPNTYSCGAIGRIGRLREMGTWFRGPALGQQISPEVGDILLFRKGHYSITVNEYYADGCGIVTEYSGNIVTVIEGDSGGAIIQMSYIVSSAIISGCFRPDWSRVDVQEKVPPSYNRIQGLYTDAVSKRDAAVREVGYLDEHYQPSINPSKVKLSMLNYTGLLGDLYSVFGGALTASDASKTSDESDFVPTLMPSGQDSDETIALSLSASEDEKARACYNKLCSSGLNSAAACGVLANIQAESHFDASVEGDLQNGVYTSFGICQWHLSRGIAMKKFVGEGWKNNLLKQVEFLIEELTSSYKGVWSVLLNVSNTAEGAKAAADKFVRDFEVPADVDNASKDRQDYAVVWFNKMINQSSAQVQKTILQSVAT